MGEGERGHSASVRAGEAVRKQGTGVGGDFRKGKGSRRGKERVGLGGKGCAGWGKGTKKGPAAVRGRPGVKQRPRAGQHKVEGVYGVGVTATEVKEREVDHSGDRRWGSGGGSEEGGEEEEGESNV